MAGLGITTGCFVHIGAAAVGVSALLAASATAFTLLKWLGAGYLLWVGVRMLFSGGTLNVPVPAGAQASSLPVPWRSVFLGGFWTNVLNPKVALFFLAFVLLGVLFNLNAMPVNVGWAVLAAWTARRVGVLQRGLNWLERVAGAMFIGFGLKLALTDNPPS